MLLADRCQVAIPLAQSWFCESCQIIANDPLCPCCKSDTHTARIADWLNREDPAITILGNPNIVYLLITPSTLLRRSHGPS